MGPPRLERHARMAAGALAVAHVAAPEWRAPPPSRHPAPAAGDAGRRCENPGSRGIPFLEAAGHVAPFLAAVDADRRAGPKSPGVHHSLAWNGLACLPPESGQRALPASGGG